MKKTIEALQPELRTESGAVAESEVQPMSMESYACNAARGAFYRPIKHPLSLRLDADVIAWFQRQGQGYQTRINSALREYIATHSNGSEVSG
ncbi:BrnA antitoxin family protein [Acidicapsa acidisoli]|uniref:BrnA antitoxin family protein n=1 Tax=Acidicapsa acidisoli TaxID=1615681 RepID=UPI0021E0DD26|nr:BrnA antitoxin family protein [Acidicapsa acidisoli]